MLLIIDTTLELLLLLVVMAVILHPVALNPAAVDFAKILVILPVVLLMFFGAIVLKPPTSTPTS